MIGNPYPQFQNVQEWNDFVNEVRNALSQMGKTITDLYTIVQQGGGYIVPDASANTKGIMKLYPTVGNNTDGTITQRALTVSQQEQDQQIAAIYATQTGMQTAIENATENAVSMIEISVTIPATGWTANGLQGYGYTVTITNSTITADMLPTLIVSDTDWSRAVACQLAPFCEAIAGGLKVYANSIPSTAINARVILESVR